MRRRRADSIKISRFDVVYRTIQPQCLGGLVTYFSQTEETPAKDLISKDDAYLFAYGIIFCAMTSIFFSHPFVLYNLQTGLRIRVSCAALIYRKVRVGRQTVEPFGDDIDCCKRIPTMTIIHSPSQALRMTKSATVDGLNGQVINLMSSDIGRLETVMALAPDLFKGPIELAVFSYFIYREIGYFGVIGIGFIVCFIPFQSEYRSPVAMALGEIYNHLVGFQCGWEKWLLISVCKRPNVLTNVFVS